MPRTRVDDLEGWPQIAPPPAVGGLTTCTTHPVAQQLVLTGFLLLFIFLMMNFNGLWPPARDGSAEPSTARSLQGSSWKTWPELMNSPGCGTRRNHFSGTRVQSKSECKAWLDAHRHSVHIMLHYSTSYQEYTINITLVPSVGKHGAALLLFLPLCKFVDVQVKTGGLQAVL